MPENGDFLLLGVAVVLTVLVLYGSSLWLRYRNLLKDRALIEQLD